MFYYSLCCTIVFVFFHALPFVYIVVLCFMFCFMVLLVLPPARGTPGFVHRCHSGGRGQSAGWKAERRNEAEAEPRPGLGFARRAAGVLLIGEVG